MLTDFEHTLVAMIEQLAAGDGGQVCDWIVDLTGDEYPAKWRDFMGELYVFAGFADQRPGKFASLDDVWLHFEALRRLL